MPVDPRSKAFYFWHTRTNIMPAGNCRHFSQAVLNIMWPDALCLTQKSPYQNDAVVLHTDKNREKMRIFLSKLANNSILTKIFSFWENWGKFSVFFFKFSYDFCQCTACTYLQHAHNIKDIKIWSKRSRTNWRFWCINVND